MTFCGPARDALLSNQETEKLNFDTIAIKQGLLITEAEAGVTNCFSINFQVFKNNNQLNFTKIHFKIITV